MSRFENTMLWQHTLATQLDPDLEAESRTKLRSAFDSFRDRAKVLAGEIAIDLPQFSVHDITHIDALWEMAQLIAGPNFPLTPTEAFVLGGAFLIHDLGMGLAAYPEGVSELRKQQLWADSVAALLKEKLGRSPTLKEVETPGAEIENQVTGMLFNRHIIASATCEACGTLGVDFLERSKKWINRVFSD